MFSLSRFPPPPSMKIIVSVLALLISWKQAIYFCVIDIYLFLSFFLFSLFPPISSYTHVYLAPNLRISSTHGVIVMYVSAPHQELSLKSLLPFLSSSLLVLRIEVWVPSHLGGRAAQSRVPWKRSVGCVPDTGRLSMHWMRSQTRWSVMGVCESEMSCVCDCAALILFLSGVCMRVHVRLHMCVCLRLCKCWKEEERLAMIF